VLVRVGKIEPGKERSFAEIAGELRKEIAFERARQELFDRHDKIEDERASGSTLTETAAKLGLKATVIEAIDRSGRAPDGKPVENVTALEQLLDGAFASQVGVETDPINLRDAGFVWYEVAAITPSRDRSLDEAREQVERLWRDEETVKRLAARAEAIRARLDAGDAFSAAAPGLRVEKRDQLKRVRAVEGIDRRTLARIFETAQGKNGIAVAAEGVNHIVFRVTAVKIPAGDSQVSKTVAELGVAIQDDLLVQYMLRLQQDIGVRVNEAAIRTVTGDPGN
jgi:peptidyl-prolyl cis-trans isomerase D